MPWQARARRRAQQLGVDPRYLRRLRWFHKARTVRRNGASVWSELGFVLWDPEPDNFTFEIENLTDLAIWVSMVGRCAESEAERIIGEPFGDRVLQEHLRRATARKRAWTKASPPFGKRVGWYALARVIRPRVIVEVGVHDGLGSLLLLRALERNEDEGHPGKLISFDVNPTAGWLVRDQPQWELRIESSESGLPHVVDREGEIDMFVYDGWHRHDAERHDHAVAADRLGALGVLVSDDAQTTRALAEICEERGLEYFEFHEVPQRHFYPGSTLGAGRMAAAG